jgi:hypothetical protein
VPAHSELEYFSKARFRGRVWKLIDQSRGPFTQSR